MPGRRRYEAPKDEEERQWVPSVKQGSASTSFSNLFGDYPEIDREERAREPKRTPETTMDRLEKLSRVSGLSSSNLNRSARGKGRRGAQELGSQIWF